MLLPPLSAALCWLLFVTECVELLLLLKNLVKCMLLVTIPGVSLAWDTADPSGNLSELKASVHCVITCDLAITSTKDLSSEQCLKHDKLSVIYLCVLSPHISGDICLIRFR